MFQTIFQTIPPEIILQILEKLSIKDILNFGLANKESYNLSQDNSLWLKRIRTDYPNLVFDCDESYKRVYFKKIFSILFIINPDFYLYRSMVGKPWPCPDEDFLLISSIVSNNANKVKEDVETFLSPNKQNRLLEDPFYLQEKGIEELLNKKDLLINDSIYKKGEFEDFNSIGPIEYKFYENQIRRKAKHVYIIIKYDIQSMEGSTIVFPKTSKQLRSIHVIDSEKDLDEWIKNESAVHMIMVPLTNIIGSIHEFQDSYSLLTKKILFILNNRGYFKSFQSMDVTKGKSTNLNFLKLPVQNQFYM